MVITSTTTKMTKETSEWTKYSSLPIRPLIEKSPMMNRMIRLELRLK
jgi:hypothetical protein